MLGASNAFRWIKCSMSAKFFGPRGCVSPDAIEGLAAHHVAQTVLMGDATCAADLIGRMSPDGFYITADMAEHVQGYLDVIGKPPLMYVEHTPQSDLIGCRIDCAIDYSTSLEIIDLKYGRQIHEAFYNPQLMIGAGLMLRPEHEHVKLSIYQPRPFHPDGVYRMHVITRYDLLNQFAYIKERAALTLHPSPPATPGRHCLGCAGAAKCGAEAATIYAGYEVIERQGSGTIPPDAVACEFEFLQQMAALVKARLNALTSEIESRLHAGEYLPGMWMKPSYGHRVFTVPPATIEAITGTPATKTVRQTPADLEKEGVSPSILAQVSAVPEIGRKVAVVTPKEIERIFNRGK